MSWSTKIQLYTHGQRQDGMTTFVYSSPIILLFVHKVLIRLASIWPSMLTVLQKGRQAATSSSANDSFSADESAAQIGVIQRQQHQHRHQHEQHHWLFRLGSSYVPLRTPHSVTIFLFKRYCLCIRFWNLLLVFVIKESMWVLLLSSENCVSVPSPCLSWKIHSKIPFLCHKRLFIGTAGAFVLVIVYGVWPIQPIHPKKQIFGCPNPLIGGESPAARRHAGWDIIPIFLCRSCWTA